MISYVSVTFCVCYAVASAVHIFRPAGCLIYITRLKMKLTKRGHEAFQLDLSESPFSGEEPFEWMEQNTTKDEEEEEGANELGRGMLARPPQDG